MSEPGKASVVTLRALEGEPLAGAGVRSMVVATAQALAERNGVTILDIQADPRKVRITLDADRIVALGLAAELRRLTTRWYTAKYGVDTLWGEPPPEEGEEWKRGR